MEARSGGFPAPLGGSSFARASCVDRGVPSVFDTVPWDSSTAPTDRPEGAGSCRHGALPLRRESERCRGARRGRSEEGQADAGVVLNKKARRRRWTTPGLRRDCRQRPTLPHSFPCSTIGGSRLNFRVRNGNGCDPAPVTTGKCAAWGPRPRARPLEPRDTSRHRSSQAIFQRTQS